MEYKVSRKGFTQLKDSKWQMGGGWHNGTCALSGKRYPRNSLILWLPDAKRKGDGYTVLVNEYYDLDKYVPRAKEIELDLNLVETNPRMFPFAKKTA
jgi:hypothetical protein